MYIFESMQSVKIIECPRDAMQGIKDWIPTERKTQYIQSLLGCGFDTIDFGSFVSPKAIPQMKDTKEVLAGLDLSDTKSKLLFINSLQNVLKLNYFISLKYSCDFSGSGFIVLSPGFQFIGQTSLGLA